VAHFFEIQCIGMLPVYATGTCLSVFTFSIFYSFAVSRIAAEHCVFLNSAISSFLSGEFS